LSAPDLTATVIHGRLERGRPGTLYLVQKRRADLRDKQLRFSVRFLRDWREWIEEGLQLARGPSVQQFSRGVG
jgi:hypothetical protein